MSSILISGVQNIKVKVFKFVHAYMTKTISISDDVYEHLVKIKGKKSFSEVIRDLIKKEE